MSEGLKLCDDGVDLCALASAAEEIRNLGDAP